MANLSDVAVKAVFDKLPDTLKAAVNSGNIEVSEKEFSAKGNKYTGKYLVLKALNEIGELALCEGSKETRRNIVSNAISAGLRSNAVNALVAANQTPEDVMDRLMESNAKKFVKQLPALFAQYDTDEAKLSAARKFLVDRIGK